MTSSQIGRFRSRRVAPKSYKNQKPTLERENVTKGDTSGMIKLREDVVFSDPQSRIREYCEIEIYHGYDDKHSIDNVISQRDVDAANNLYAMIGRYDKDESARLLSHSKSIIRFLASIPNVNIHEVVDSEWPRIRRRIGELLIEFLSIKGIGLAKATKILHLKRPNLIPVLDSLVINFLLGINISGIDKRRQVEIGLQALDHIRKTIINQKSAFEKLAEETRDLPIQLTIIRLFDILCWTAEKWDIRKNTNAPRGHASKSLLQTSTKKDPLNWLADQTSKPIELEKCEIKTLEDFRRIHASGEGFIVITDNANPNKIHLPYCRTLKEENFRKKVIENKGKNGRYYWIDDPRKAQILNAIPCNVCKPTIPKK